MLKTRTHKHGQKTGQLTLLRLTYNNIVLIIHVYMYIYIYIKIKHRPTLSKIRFLHKQGVRCATDERFLLLLLLELLLLLLFLLLFRHRTSEFAQIFITFETITAQFIFF